MPQLYCFNPFTPKFKKYILALPFKEEHIYCMWGNENKLIGSNHLSSEKAMKNRVLHTVCCHMSGEAAGETWNWSLLGVKGKSVRVVVSFSLCFVNQSYEILQALRAATHCQDSMMGFFSLVGVWTSKLWLSQEHARWAGSAKEKTKEEKEAWWVSHSDLVTMLCFIVIGSHQPCGYYGINTAFFHGDRFSFYPSILLITLLWA